MLSPEINSAVPGVAVAGIPKDADVESGLPPFNMLCEQGSQQQLATQNCQGIASSNQAANQIVSAPVPQTEVDLNETVTIQSAYNVVQSNTDPKGDDRPIVALCQSRSDGQVLIRKVAIISSTTPSYPGFCDVSDLNWHPPWRRSRSAKKKREESTSARKDQAKKSKSEVVLASKDVSKKSDNAASLLQPELESGDKSVLQASGDLELLRKKAQRLQLEKLKLVQKNRELEKEREEMKKQQLVERQKQQLLEKPWRLGKTPTKEPSSPRQATGKPHCNDELCSVSEGADTEKARMYARKEVREYIRNQKRQRSERQAMEAQKKRLKEQQMKEKLKLLREKSLQLLKASKSNKVCEAAGNKKGPPPRGSESSSALSSCTSPIVSRASSGSATKVHTPEEMKLGTDKQVGALPKCSDVASSVTLTEHQERFGSNGSLPEVSSQERQDGPEVLLPSSQLSAEPRLSISKVTDTEKNQERIGSGGLSVEMPSEGRQKDPELQVPSVQLNARPRLSVPKVRDTENHQERSGSDGTLVEAMSQGRPAGSEMLVPSAQLSSRPQLSMPKVADTGELEQLIKMVQRQLMETQCIQGPLLVAPRQPAITTTTHEYSSPPGIPRVTGLFTKHQQFPPPTATSFAATRMTRLPGASPQERECTQVSLGTSGRIEAPQDKLVRGELSCYSEPVPQVSDTGTAPMQFSYHNMEKLTAVSSGDRLVASWAGTTGTYTDVELHKKINALLQSRAQEKAAIKIQAIVRGYLCRKNLSKNVTVDGDISKHVEVSEAGRLLQSDDPVGKDGVVGDGEVGSGGGCSTPDWLKPSRDVLPCPNNVLSVALKQYTRLQKLGRLHGPPISFPGQLSPSLSDECRHVALQTELQVSATSPPPSISSSALLPPESNGSSHDSGAYEESICRKESFPDASSTTGPGEHSCEVPAQNETSLSLVRPKVSLTRRWKSSNPRQVASSKSESLLEVGDLSNFIQLRASSSDTYDSHSKLASLRRKPRHRMLKKMPLQQLRSSSCTFDSVQTNVSVMAPALVQPQTSMQEDPEPSCKVMNAPAMPLPTPPLPEREHQACAIREVQGDGCLGRLSERIAELQKMCSEFNRSLEAGRQSLDQRVRNNRTQLERMAADMAEKGRQAIEEFMASHRQQDIPNMQYDVLGGTGSRELTYAFKDVQREVVDAHKTVIDTFVASSCNTSKYGSSVDEHLNSERLEHHLSDALEQSVASIPELNLSSRSHKHALAIAACHMYDELVRDEEEKLKQQDELYKERMKLLNVRTHSSLQWLLLKKQEYRGAGSSDKVSSVRKKQRRIVIKYHEEKEKILQLQKLNRQACEDRVRSLKKQQKAHKEIIDRLLTICQNSHEPDSSASKRIGSDGSVRSRNIHGGNGSGGESVSGIFEELLYDSSSTEKSKESDAWGPLTPEVSEGGGSSEVSVGHQGEVVDVVKNGAVLGQSAWYTMSSRLREVKHTKSASSSIETVLDAPAHDHSSGGSSTVHLTLSRDTTTNNINAATTTTTTATTPPPPGDNDAATAAPYTPDSKIDEGNNMGIVDSDKFQKNRFHEVDTQTVPATKVSLKSSKTVRDVSTSPVKQQQVDVQCGSPEMSQISEEPGASNSSYVPEDVKSSSMSELCGKSQMSVAVPERQTVVVATHVSEAKYLPLGLRTPLSLPPARRHRRRHSSASDDSIIYSQNDTLSEQSDVEGRIAALREQLDRRKREAEKLLREQKRKMRERLKAKEESLLKQIEAYDELIERTKQELVQDMNSSSSVVIMKPKIKQPRVAEKRRQSDVQQGCIISALADTSKEPTVPPEVVVPSVSSSEAEQVQSVASTSDLDSITSARSSTAHESVPEEIVITSSNEASLLGEGEERSIVSSSSPRSASQDLSIPTAIQSPVKLGESYDDQPSTSNHDISEELEVASFNIERGAARMSCDRYSDDFEVTSVTSDLAQESVQSEVDKLSYECEHAENMSTGTVEAMVGEDECNAVKNVDATLADDLHSVEVMKNASVTLEDVEVIDGDGLKEDEVSDDTSVVENLSAPYVHDGQQVEGSFVPNSNVEETVSIPLPANVVVHAEISSDESCFSKCQVTEAVSKHSSLPQHTELTMETLTAEVQKPLFHSVCKLSLVESISNFILGQILSESMVMNKEHYETFIISSACADASLVDSAAEVKISPSCHDTDSEVWQDKNMTGLDKVDGSLEALSFIPADEFSFKEASFMHTDVFPSVTCRRSEALEHERGDRITDSLLEECMKHAAQEVVEICSNRYTPAGGVDVGRRVQERLTEATLSTSPARNKCTTQELIVTTQDLVPANVSDRQHPSGSSVERLPTGTGLEQDRKVHLCDHTEVVTGAVGIHLSKFSHADCDNEWFDEDYGLSRRREAEELRRQQLRIEREIQEIQQAQQEQCPYFYIREIPNKPPPPYTPPLQASRAQALPSAPNKELVSNLVRHAAERAYDAIQAGDDPDSLQVQHVQDTRVAFHHFLLHLSCRLVKDACGWEQIHCAPRLPWECVPRARIPQPRSREMVMELVQTEALVMLHFVPRSSGPMRNAHKKRDLVDELLVREGHAEEPGWTDYREDEVAVKNQLTDKLLSLLLDDAICVLRDVVAKRCEAMQYLGLTS